MKAHLAKRRHVRRLPLDRRLRRTQRPHRGKRLLLIQKTRLGPKLALNRRQSLKRRSPNLRVRRRLQNSPRPIPRNRLAMSLSVSNGHLSNSFV